MKKLLVVLLLLSVSLFAKEVTVSILPQKYFVEKIAGDKVKVNVMVRKGFSPATYEPKISQMRKLSKSIIYFSIGVPFEKVWLDKFANTNKNLLIVDTSKGITKLKMEKHVHHEVDDHEEKEHMHKDEEKHDMHKEAHDHKAEHKHDEHEHEAEHKDDEHEHEAEHKDDEHEAEHNHGGLNPHIWLDPILVKKQAKNIYEALIKADPQNSEYYKRNYEIFIKELETLYVELKDILSGTHEKAFMVFHPSWGYFAKRFHLEEIAVEVQGKEPKPSQLLELIAEAKKHDIKIVFVSPQFSQKSAKQIAKSINGRTAVINPLSLDWAKNLKYTAKQIVSSYK